MASALAWTTETRPRKVKESPRCGHGKDAGQTCYPCEVGADELLDRCCGCVGAHCCTHGEAPCST